VKSKRFKKIQKRKPLYTKTYKDYLNACTKKDTRDIGFSKNFLNPPTYENQFIQKKARK
jgi:hypothetical protein